MSFVYETNKSVRWRNVADAQRARELLGGIQHFANREDFLDYQNLYLRDWVRELHEIIERYDVPEPESP